MALPFSIVIPTYNEAGGIEKLLRGGLTSSSAANDLDGEIDRRRRQFARRNRRDRGPLAAELPVRCLHRPGKMGLSSGVIDGWKFARPESVALGAMDADFSHDITILPKMVEALDVGRLRPGRSAAATSPAAASRTGPSAASSRRKVACMLARPLTNVKDITSGYFLVHARGDRRRRTGSDRFQDRPRSDRQGALRARDRDSVRVSPIASSASRS